LVPLRVSPTAREIQVSRGFRRTGTPPKRGERLSRPNCSPGGNKAGRLSNPNKKKTSKQGENTRGLEGGRFARAVHSLLRVAIVKATPLIGMELILDQKKKGPYKYKPQGKARGGRVLENVLRVRVGPNGHQDTPPYQKCHRKPMFPHSKGGPGGVLRPKKGQCLRGKGGVSSRGRNAASCGKRMSKRKGSIYKRRHSTKPNRDLNSFFKEKKGP